MITAVLLSLGFFIRLLNIGRDFSGDETILIWIARHDFSSIIPLLTKTEVYPPLTYMTVHFLMGISQSATFIRAYFVLFGVGTSFVTYLLSKEYLGPKFAKIALLLSVFSPLLIFGSQYVRSYIDSAFWMLLSVFFLLRIIKGRDGIANMAGYLISAAISLYTFYFSAFLILAQFLFVAIFGLRNKRSALRWALSYICIVAAFLPWLGHAASQFHNVSSMAYDWSGKGLNLGPVRVGLFMRNILSLVGFDPYFMVFQGGVTSHFSKVILITACAAALGLFIYFSLYYFRYLRSRFDNRRELVWFFPFMIFVPLAICWAQALFLNILVNAKYLMALHALFLIIVAVAIYSVLERRKLIGIGLLILIVALFCMRIPSAISAEFDSKGAVKFLTSNLGKDDGLVCMFGCPQDLGTREIIEMDKYFILNSNKSAYIASSKENLPAMRDRLRPFTTIWFYRVYGNAEAFGANNAIANMLKTEGYIVDKVERFRNIDVMKYIKRGE